MLKERLRRDSFTLTLFGSGSTSISNLKKVISLKIILLHDQIHERSRTTRHRCIQLSLRHQRCQLVLVFTRGSFPELYDHQNYIVPK